MRSAAKFFEGERIRIRYKAGLRDTAGNPAHAATSIRDRVITLDPELKAAGREHERILLHEYFHFVWVRLGNPKRREWEKILSVEWASRVRGEAGWSAEWRKKELGKKDVRTRTRRWREYCCESFCDTGAWWKGGCASENTLGKRRLRERETWFCDRLGGGALLV